MKQKAMQSLWRRNSKSDKTRTQETSITLHTSVPACILLAIELTSKASMMSEGKSWVQILKLVWQRKFLFERREVCTSIRMIPHVSLLSGIFVMMCCYEREFIISKVLSNSSILGIQTTRFEPCWTDESMWVVQLLSHWSSTGTKRMGNGLTCRDYVS